MSTLALEVVAVGDLQLGDSPICVGFGFASLHQTVDRFRDALRAVTPALAGADIVIGNLETVLVQPRGPFTLDRAQLRGYPFYAAELRRAGFSILHVANNHAVQHGLPTFLESVNAVRSAGIACCGLRGANPWTSDPVRMTLPNGTRVGILGYCRRPRQYGNGVPPYAEGTDAEILADVVRLRAEMDAIIVSMHWGEEFVSQPSTTERDFGAAVARAGANLIVGHHPHVTRPIATLNRSVIAYSLGNFVSDMIWQDQLRRGLLLRCRIDDQGAHILEALPTYIDRRFHVGLSNDPIRDSLTASAPLDEYTYQRAVTRTVRRQQVAAYGYALRNLHRYRKDVLYDLLATTFKNKLSVLRGGPE